MTSVLHTDTSFHTKIQKYLIQILLPQTVLLEPGNGAKYCFKIFGGTKKSEVSLQSTEIYKTVITALELSLMFKNRKVMLSPG